MNKIIKISGMLVIGSLLVINLPYVSAQSATPTVTTRGAAIKETAVARAKVIANNLFTNQYIAKLNALRARVSANANLGEDSKEVILAKIDVEITWFTSKSESIESFSTLAQVRGLVNEARTRFLSIAKEIRRLHIASGFVVSLDKVITNLEKNIIPKIEIKLISLSAEGKDVVAEQALLVKAKTEVSAAKSDITAIRNSTTLELAKKNFDSAKEHLKNARQSLKDLLTGLKTKL